LHTAHHGPTTRDAYLEVYPAFIALGDGELSTGGYAPSFIEDWFDARVKGGQMEDVRGYRFTETYGNALVATMDRCR